MELQDDLDTTTTDIAPDVQEPQVDTQTQPDEVDPEDFYNDGEKDGQQTEAQPDGEGEGEGEALEPIDAPLSWAKDAKEQFSKLPREAQEIIATRERDREVALQAKFREAANTRQQVETEARQALQTIMQNHEQSLQQYAAQIIPVQPDLRLLNSDDPSHRSLYFQQEAEYRAATAQREQLTQQMQEARQHAEAIQLHQQQAELQAEHQVLEERLGTEWSDPSARAKLLGDLTPIAAELGYPQDLIAQARACDILAMNKARDWKAKAEKYDALNKAKMVPVRAAKGAIPPTARTAAPQGNRPPVSVEAQLYPNDVRRN